MFGNKEVSQIKEELDSLSKQFSDNSSKIDTMSSSIGKLKEEIDLLIESQGKLIQKSKEDSVALGEVKEDLRKEITDFKVLKSRIQNQLVQRFEEELKEELLPRFDLLEKHVKSFEELSSKITFISNRVVDVSTEIQKFIDISSEIKKGDFELTKYASKLKDMENDKLELLRKIDSLERLVSKMRRR